MQTLTAQTNTPDRKDEGLKTGLAACAGFLTFVAGLNGGWLGPLIPSIAKFQNLPLSQVGYLVSFLCAGCFISQLSGPKILSLMGGQKALIIGSLLLASGMVFLGLAKGLPAILISSLLVGLGTGLNSIAGHVAILRYFKEHAASALSKLNIYYGIGALLAPQIVQLSGADKGGNYLFVFLVSAFLAALTSIKLKKLSGLSDESQDEESEADKTLPLPVTLTESRIVTLPLVLVCLVVFLYVGTETATATWLFTYMQDNQKLSAQACSLAVTCLFVGLTSGRLLSIKASKIFKNEQVTLAALSTMFGSFLVLNLIQPSLPVNIELVCLITSFMIGFGFGPIFPQIIAQTAALVNNRPPLVSKYTSYAISSGAVGGIIMPGLAGQIMAHSSIGLTMQSITALSATLAIAYLIFLSNNKKYQKVEL
ncbi:MAG: MFS transporter [Candidatus Obscuribacterales bacterium]|nr:MFS transporter [Candidatus Obscuribacterales bacterium]